MSIFVCFVVLAFLSTSSGIKYKDNDKVILYVNKVGPYFNPHETYHYYQLPVCRPKKIEHKSLTLGEVLDGDRMALSEYDIRFTRDSDKKELCKVTFTEQDLQLLRDAIEDLYYFEFVIDEIPVRGFIGHLEEGGFLPHNHKVFLWAHLNFNIEYNGNQVIYANVTTKEQAPVSLDGVTAPYEVVFTYSVKWMKTNMAYDDRAKRVRDNSFFPKTLEVLQEVEEDMSLANASETIEENIRLSQIHPNMEPFYNMSVSQAVDYYHLGTFDLGDFLLTDFKDEDVEPVRFTAPVLDEDVEPVRFTAPVSDEDIEKLISSQTNANTKKNTKWSIGVFNEWRIARSKHGDSIADIHMLEAAEMNHWLQRFVIEVRNKKGEEYPPKSLYSIICGLLRYCKDMNVNDKNFLDEKDLRFVTFRRVLDSRMKELLSKGFGTKVKRADPLSLQDEEHLWQKGVFGMTNSVSLQHTAFFYACKLFGLRGRDEHRNLDCSQFEIGTDQTGKYVRFIGRSTKTFKGGLSHLSLDNKDIKHYSEEGPRCIATHFQKYLEALGNDGIFYRKPLEGNSEQTVRYGKQAVGINKLDLFMKEICQKGGIQGNFSNHSGKRTCATQLYQAGIEEQEIMGRTGHRSNAVRTYKTSNETIQKKVSHVLNPPRDATETAEGSLFEENSSDEPTTENTSVLATPPMKRQRTTPEILKDVTNTKGVVQFSNCNFNFH